MGGLTGRIIGKHRSKNRISLLGPEMNISGFFYQRQSTAAIWHQDPGHGVLLRPLYTLEFGSSVRRRAGMTSWTRKPLAAVGNAHGVHIFLLALELLLCSGALRDTRTSLYIVWGVHYEWQSANHHS